MLTSATGCPMRAGHSGSRDAVTANQSSALWQVSLRAVYLFCPELPFTPALTDIVPTLHVVPLNISCH